MNLLKMAQMQQHPHPSPNVMARALANSSQSHSQPRTHLAELRHLQLCLRRSLHSYHCLLLEAADGTKVLVGDIGQRGQEQGIGKRETASGMVQPPHPSSGLQTPLPLEEKWFRGVPVPKTLSSLPISPSKDISGRLRRWPVAGAAGHSCSGAGPAPSPSWPAQPDPPAAPAASPSPPRPQRSPSPCQRRRHLSDSPAYMYLSPLSLTLTHPHIPCVPPASLTSTGCCSWTSCG